MLYECKTIEIANNFSIQVGMVIGFPIAEEDEYGGRHKREVDLILFVPTKNTIEYLLDNVDQEIMNI